MMGISASTLGHQSQESFADGDAIMSAKWRLDTVPKDQEHRFVRTTDRPTGARLLTFVAAATTAGLGALLAIVGLLGSLSFFGQGDDEAFSRWSHRPLLVGGLLALVVGLVALVAVALINRRALGQMVAVIAALAGVASIAIGLVDWHTRAHPQGFERSAVAKLGVGNAASTRTTLGSVPVGRSTVAGPSSNGPPVAVRSSRPTSCTALNTALQGWADSGSVHVPPSFTTGDGAPACLWFATYRGWSVRGEVLGSGEAGTSLVVIAPPGVGL
jgi:hypothetical protein